MDIAVTKTPRRHNKDVVLNLIKKVGDHTLLKRLQLVDKAVDMAIVFAKLKKLGTMILAPKLDDFPVVRSGW